MVKSIFNNCLVIHKCTSAPFESYFKKIQLSLVKTVPTYSKHLEVFYYGPLRILDSLLPTDPCNAWEMQIPAHLPEVGSLSAFPQYMSEEPFYLTAWKRVHT